MHESNCHRHNSRNQKTQKKNVRTSWNLCPSLNVREKTSTGEIKQPMHNISKTGKIINRKGGCYGK